MRWPPCLSEHVCWVRSLPLSDIRVWVFPGPGCGHSLFSLLQAGSRTRDEQVGVKGLVTPEAQRSQRGSDGGVSEVSGSSVAGPGEQRQEA